MNNEYKVSNKIKITQSLGFSNVNNTPKPLSAFTTAYKQSPLVPIRFANGNYGQPFIGANGFADPSGVEINNVGNPVAELDLYNEKQRTFDIYGGVTGEYKITDYLKFTSQFGGEYNTFKSYNFTDFEARWLWDNPSSYIGSPDFNAYFTAVDPETGKLKNARNTLEQKSSDFFNWNWSNYLTFTKKFGAHDLEVTAGIEASSIGSVDNFQRKFGNVPSLSNYWNVRFSSTTDFDSYNKDDNKLTNASRLNSYFGRVQYTFMDRYLLSASIRRDGSSKYQDGKRWGTFPSVGLGWIISKESFMQDSFFNFLKIRGGWGKLGNQNVPPNYATFKQFNYGIGGSVNPGISIDKQIDPNLTWETTEEFSAGIDFEVVNRKLKGSVDVYDKKNKNVILGFVPTITTGLGDTSYAYIGGITNKGIETNIRWDDKIGEDWKYWIGGNYSYNKNNLYRLDVPPSITGGSLGNGHTTKLLAEGQPLGSFWLWEVAGYDDQGNFTYYDKNGNIVSKDQLTKDDKKFFGSVMPSSYYGINLGIQYKNIDLSIDGYGTAGAKVYNGKKAQRNGNENIEYNVAADFWTSTNTSAANPAPKNEQPIESNYFLESGDYFRINNITIGYTFPKFSEAVSSFRIYASAINPFIWQKFSGYSPELNGDGNPVTGTQGIELDAYPTVRSFVVGFNIKF